MCSNLTWSILLIFLIDWLFDQGFCQKSLLFRLYLSLTCWNFKISCQSCCLFVWMKVFLEFRHQNIIYLINCHLAECKGFITWLNSRILVELVKGLLGSKTYITEVTWPRWKHFYLTPLLIVGMRKRLESIYKIRGVFQYYSSQIECKIAVIKCFSHC